MPLKPELRSLLPTLLVALAVLWVANLPAFFWTSDGPEHVYSAAMLAGGDRIMTTATGTGAVLEVHTPLLAVGYLWSASLLDPILGPFATHRLLLSCILLANLLGAIVLAARVGGNRSAALILGGLSFNYLLYFGFFNYLTAQALALWLLAWAWSTTEWNRLRVVTLASSLLFVGWLHPLPALFVGLFLGIGASTSGTITDRLRRLAVLGLASVPFLVLLALTSLDVSGNTYDAAQPPILVQSLLGSTSIGGPAWRGLPLLVCGAAGMLWSMFRGQSIQKRVLGAATLLLLIFGMTGPFSLPNWEVFAPRFALFACYIGIALLPAIPGRAGRQAFAASAVVVLASNLFWVADLNRRVSNGCEDLLRAAAELPDHEGVSRYVLARTCLSTESPHDVPELPTLSFGLHGGALVALGRNAMHAGFNGQPSIHAHTLRVYTPFVSPRLAINWIAVRQHIEQLGEDHPLSMELVARAALFAAHGDRVVLFGPTDGVEPVLAYGFAHEASVGDVHSFRYEPIAGDDATLRILAPQPGIGTEVDYGWVPLADSYATFRLEPQADRESTEQRLPLPLLPHARFWVRVRPLAPHDDLRCRGANEDNLLVFDFSREPHPMVCELETPVLQ